MPEGKRLYEDGWLGGHAPPRLVRFRLPDQAKSVIPPEIISFLSQSGRILLVKGAAGTGKTLFCAETARWFQSVSGDVIWIASRHIDPAEHLDLEALMPKERRFLAAGGSAVHSGSPSGSGGAPPGWAHVIDQVAQDSGEGPMLVILDSLEGLLGIDHAEIDALVAGVKDVIQQGDVRVVAVAESDAPHPADHLVDGILHMAQEVVDHTRVRHCRILKLRGTSLARSAYPFTLAEGRFSAFVGAAEEDVPRPVRPTGRAAPGGGMSTGTNGWDLLLEGGFAAGSAHLLEHSAEVRAFLHWLTVPMAVNALAMGWDVLCAGLSLDHAKRLDAMVSRHVGQAERERFSTLRDAPFTLWRGNPPGARDTEERLAPLHTRRAAARAEGKVLTILDLDGLSSSGDGLDPGWLAAWTQESRRSGAVDLLLVTERTAETFAAFADDWWRVRRFMGAPIFCGVVPATENHLLHLTTARGYPETRLQPLH